MAIQLSTTVRNAMLDAIEATIGTAAKIQLFTGSQPATCATADSGTKLVDASLASDWAGNASAGVKAFTIPSLTAIAVGSVGHFRIKDSSGATCHYQGSVTATGGGGDLTIDNVGLVVGQVTQFTGWSVTQPGA